MPEISRFYGIVIRMFFDDHHPAHFHAAYGGQEVVVGINPIRVENGALPTRALSMVLEWAALNQEQLAANWDRLRRDQPAEKIPPLG
jgi:hypothetical protein